MPNVSSGVAPCPDPHMAEHLLSKLLPRSTCRNSTASLTDSNGAWKHRCMLGMIRLTGCNAFAKALALPVEMCHLLPSPTCRSHGMGWGVMSEAWQIAYPAAAVPHGVRQRVSGFIFSLCHRASRKEAAVWLGNSDPQFPVTGSCWKVSRDHLKLKLQVTFIES